MTLLPTLSEDVAKCEHASELVQIWQKRISFQTEEERAAAKKAPKTVLSVVPAKMKALLSDSDNPLHGEECSDMATEFILDHVSKYPFDSESAGLITLDGSPLKTMSGKKLVFVKDAELDKYLVNGVEVEAFTALADGTLVICIKDFLFKYEEKIRDVLKETSKPGLKSRIKSIFKCDDKGEEE